MTESLAAWWQRGHVGSGYMAAQPVLGIGGYPEPRDLRAGCQLLAGVRVTVITAILAQNTLSDMLGDLLP